MLCVSIFLFCCLLRKQVIAVSATANLLLLKLNLDVMTVIISSLWDWLQRALEKHSQGFISSRGVCQVIVCLWSKVYATKWNALCELVRSQTSGQMSESVPIRDVATKITVRLDHFQSFVFVCFTYALRCVEDLILDWCLPIPGKWITIS